MGYTLTIGEAYIDWSEDLVRVCAALVKHDNAPAFGEPTDHENQRWPSYSSWHNFCEDVGLLDVMFNERNGGAGSFAVGDKEFAPLIVHHPGCEPITRSHLQFIEERVQAYKAKHPTHIAQFPPPKADAKPIDGNHYRQEDLDDDPKFDGNLCRAEWLLYWLRWAIDNCERPVFENT